MHHKIEWFVLHERIMASTAPIDSPDFIKLSCVKAVAAVEITVSNPR